MQSIKNIKVGKLNKFLILLIILISLCQFNYVKSQENLIGKNTSIKILDKISSKNELINLVNGEELIYKFDDNPEIKAYIQVRDLTKKDNDKVYVFNNWMFSSSPSITPFDHPVYDIWLTGCD